MAFTKSKPVALATRRTGGTVSKVRYSEAIDRAKNAGKRLREATKDDEDALVTVGTGVALALAEARYKLPTIGGFDPAVLGGILGYAVTRKAKGKSGRMVRSAAIGLLTIGANRSITRGSVRIGDDDSGEDIEDEDSDL